MLLPNITPLGHYYTPWRIAFCGAAHFTLGFCVAYMAARAFLCFRGVKIYKPSLVAGLIGGVANVLVDVDHFSLFFNNIFGSRTGRISHTAFLILACGIAIISGTRLLRILFGVPSKDAKEEKYLLWFFVAAASVISHVLEDYWFGYF